MTRNIRLLAVYFVTIFIVLPAALIVTILAVPSWGLQASLIVPILVVLPVVVVMLRMSFSGGAESDAENAEVEKMKEPNGDSPYHDLRSMALDVRAEDFGLEPAPDETDVFGVVLDVVTEDAAATFAAYRTGIASMYTSSGGAQLGAGGYENVRRAAIALVECAESHFEAFTPANDDTPLPAPGYARFYLVTDRGRFFADEPVEALFTATGDLPELTQAANALFTELRVLDEAMQQEDQ